MKVFRILPVSLCCLASLASSEKASLQWAICEPSPQDALPKLGLEGSVPPYKENPIEYYDEHPPIHVFSGLMFRTKTNKGQPLSTVKVSFQEETRDVPDFVNCSWGRYGNNTPTFTCEKRCPLSRTLREEIWCDEQIQLAQRYYNVDWAALSAYGPYRNPKWKIRIEGHKAKFDDVVAGSQHIMEIEIKVPTEQANKATESITRYLMDQGVNLCERQEGKTMRLIRSMRYTNYKGDEL